LTPVDFEAPTWGAVAPAELERIVVVSPHFDDAAQGAGLLLLRHAGRSGTAVVTVMAGWPPAYPDPVSDWDALGGFKPGDDVVAVRREEDRAAMEVLGADYLWLDFVDHQYLRPEQRPSPEVVASALEDALLARRPTAVFVPFGLANPDHVLVHEASLLVREQHPEWAWFCYEDHGYKHLPGLLAHRVGTLLKSGTWPTPALVPVGTDVEAKRRAMWCYRSQIPPLERDHNLSERMAANAAEQFWRLAAPPRGWEGLADLL
jgi:LmbE family N-acetylglucosaminyl deacetylase